MVASYDTDKKKKNSQDFKYVTWVCTQQCQTMRLESICPVTAVPHTQLSTMFSDVIAPPSCTAINNIIFPHFILVFCYLTLG